MRINLEKKNHACLCQSYERIMNFGIILCIFTRFDTDGKIT